jgi:transposase-like protein
MTGIVRGSGKDREHLESSMPENVRQLLVLYLAIRNASEKWTMPIRDWGQALNQFAIELGNERVPFK